MNFLIFIIFGHRNGAQAYYKWCPEVESNHRHKDFQFLSLE